MIQRLLDGDADVAVVEALQCAAVRPHQGPAAGEGIEIAPDGHRRDVEALDEVLDRDAILLVEQIEDAPAPLLDQQLQRFPVRDFDHDYAHLGFDRDDRLAGGLGVGVESAGRAEAR